MTEQLQSYRRMRSQCGINPLPMWARTRRHAEASRAATSRHATLTIPAPAVRLRAFRMRNRHLGTFRSKVKDAGRRRLARWATTTSAAAQCGSLLTTARFHARLSRPRHLATAQPQGRSAEFKTKRAQWVRPHLCRCDSLSMINTYTSTGTPGASPTGNRCCGGWWILGEQTPCPPPPPVGEYMLPFHVNFSATSGECMNAPESERFSHSSSLASQTKRFLPSCALCFALVCLRQWTSRRMWACGTMAQWTAGTRRASPATA